MNFLFKIILLLASSVYGLATCTTPESNASNSLRLAHSVCPKLFITDDKIKEKTVIQYYRNDHRNFGKKGYPISITLNGDIIRQAWDTSLAITVGYLKQKIIATGKYTVLQSNGKLTVTAMTSGYRIDATANGGTQIGREYNGSADVNFSESGTRYYDKDGNFTYTGLYGDGYDAPQEVKEYNLTNEKVRFGTAAAPITHIFLSINGKIQVDEKIAVATGIDTAAELVAKLNTITTIATIAGTADAMTITNNVGGVATDTVLKLDYNSTGTEKNVSRTLIGKVTFHGKIAKNSRRKVYYYGNEGNYSIAFFKTATWDGNETGKMTYRTPYLKTMRKTLDKLALLVDSDGVYDASVGLANEAEGYGYLSIYDRTAREHEHNISGSSGDGNASVKVQIQGMAVPEDINMTYITYNDNYLYTSFRVDYDINYSDGNYTEDKQDILEIFRVYHADATGNAVINTIDLTSVEVLRQDDNITSIVAMNDIVFVGDVNSSYYKFNRNNPQLKNKDLKDEKKINRAK